MNGQKLKEDLEKLLFNEPVEQLLFLASEHLKPQGRDKKKESDVKSALVITKKSNAFPINVEYAK
jgi:hypothetical protein